MFSRLFGVKLPQPSESQINFKLPPFDCSLDSEITSFAYEPRFSLLGAGTSLGSLHVINVKKNICYHSSSTLRSPICKLIPLVNSSSFLSVCSKHMFQSHPSYTREKSDDKYNQFKKWDLNRVPNVIGHWIVRNEGGIIDIRSNVITFNVVDVGISQSHPNFILLLTDKGSIYGYSIEDMKFTNLYIDEFEKNLPKNIFGIGDMKFVIAHEKIQLLNIQSMEMDNYSNLKIKNIDIVDDVFTGINDENKPCICIGNKVLSTLELKEGDVVIATGMISGKNWYSIIRTKDGDKIFVNNDEKITLNKDDKLVPGSLICYKDYFAKKEPEFVAFLTEKGKLINLDGGSQDFFITSMFEPKKLYVDNNRYYVFNENEILVFTNLCFQSRFSNKYDLPIAIKNYKVIVVKEIEDKTIMKIADIRTDEEQILFENVNYYYNNDDFIYVNSGDQINSKIVLTKDEIVNETVTEVNDPHFDEKIVKIREFKDSVLIITKDNLLIYNECKIQLFEEPEEKVILFEIIDETGKLNKSGDFILIVSKLAIYIFIFTDNNLKRARRTKLSDNIIDATVVEWGSLLVLLPNAIHIVTLPDPSYDPVGKLSIGKESRAVLIEHKGIILFDQDNIFFYLPDYYPQIYDKETPQLQVPRTNAIQRLFGQKEATLQDTDAAFQHKRTMASANKLQETTEILQQMLVTAQKRGETLNEMEMKANKILESARKFRQLCREFKR